MFSPPCDRVSHVSTKWQCHARLLLPCTRMSHVRRGGSAQLDKLRQAESKKEVKGDESQMIFFPGVYDMCASISGRPLAIHLKINKITHLERQHQTLLRVYRTAGYQLGTLGNCSMEKNYTHAISRWVPKSEENSRREPHPPGFSRIE